MISEIAISEIVISDMLWRRSLSCRCVRCEVFVGRSRLASRRGEPTLAVTVWTASSGFYGDVV